MKRTERVYFPRRTRAPYLTRTSADDDDDDEGYGAFSASLAARRSAPPHGDPSATGVNANAASASSNSTWNEADAAGGTVSTAALASPSAALRAIASVPRLARVSSEASTGTIATVASSSARAAILPAHRRSSETNLTSRDGNHDNHHNNGDRQPPHRQRRTTAAHGSGNHTDAAGTASGSPAGGGGVGAHVTTDHPHHPSTTTTPDWRLRVKMRTVGVGLVLALNIGTDPPDTVKPHPCAVQQCWMDPLAVSRYKAKEWIGERLEAQYAVWQLARAVRPPLRYRRALDPTVEDVRNLCVQLRRQARNERVLLHYNGHGVPRPTTSGEIWVFDKNHTEYIPLPVADLKQWLGRPSMIVLDCSAAGVLLPYWNGTVDAATGNPVAPTEPVADMETQANRWVQDTIVLAPCSASEVLPMNPDYPADIFTSCLTTPIPMALRWFVRRHPQTGLDFENLPIPGQANDRKSPLGELNWIFTAVTDSIAWNVLPRALFQRLFRQDLLVASMFRNFLLADRILRTLNCTPVSHPPLPPGMSNHPLWQAWDLVCENLLFQLATEGILPRATQTPGPTAATTPGSPVSSPSDDDGDGADGAHEEVDMADRPPQPPAAAPSTANICISSPFFAEQLTAFEVWLDFMPIHKQRLAEGKLETPEQLSVVLQVLLSQTHRIRALVLLRRFLQLGPWAINAALSLGIFPYILKLLQSPEYKSLSVSIWASILSFDPSCRVDLLKDGSYSHFVQHVMWGLTPPIPSADLAQAARERTLAAYCMAAITHNYPAGQAEAVRLNLHGNGCALLSSYVPQAIVDGSHSSSQDNETMEMHLPAHFRLWLILCMANMIQNNPPTQQEAYATQVHSHIMERCQDESVDVRAAAAYALGCFLSAPTSSRPTSRSPSMQEMASRTGQHQQGNNSGGLGMQVQDPMSGGAQTLSGPFMPPAGMSGGFLQAQPGLGISTGSTTASFNPQSVGPPHWQANRANAPPGLNPIGQFLAPTQGQQQTISLPNAPASSYSMTGPPLMSTMPQPGGFLVGGGGVNSNSNASPPQFLHSPAFPPMQSESRSPLRPSVFEDHTRLDLDLTVLDKLVEAADDASVVVRYEATVGMARAVGKYIEAFIVVASGLVSATSRSRNSPSSRRNFPIPHGLERRYLNRFEKTWTVLRRLQHEDPFPFISKAASQIVSVVHEHLLRFRMEVEKAESSKSEDLLGLHPKKLADVILAGIDEEINDSKDSDHSLPNETSVLSSSSPRKPELHELRRVASEFAMAHAPLEAAARRAVLTDDMPMHYSLPKSEFYDWKKSSFDLMLDTTEDDEEMDPLSPTGAALVYQERRNAAVREAGVELAKKFEILAPKAPKPSKKTIESLLEEDEEDVGADQAIVKKKEALKMRETKILRNNDGKMTSMLEFHPFEDVIMICGANDNVSMWSTETATKLTTIENGNPSPSRMTYSTWMNEESSSLFLVGCDDGSIRIWGEMLEPNGEPSSKPPTLVSSFYAASMSPGQVGRSGLVCEWQPFNGTLLTGGNSDFVTCWDVQSEKRFLQLETNSDACITTMSTAWDYDALGRGPNPQGHRGLGRDVILTGFSNGSMKIFDLRASQSVTDITTSRPNRSRITGYAEHKHWIVNCAFTGYGGRYEFISGTTAGEIKAWDLRMSKSTRTFEAHRSGMTTLAVHSKVPLVATGTSSQFIKIFSPDGDMLQAFRYHEKMRSHRIGPVSCLAFHRYKPLLATGATDTFVGIYSSQP